MIATFVDTSHIIALAAPRDPLHARAVRWRYARTGPCVTTEYVLLEVADGFAAKDLRSVARTIIDSFRSDPAIRIMPANAHWFDRGYQLFCARPDKNWGLTDCISFEVMRELGVPDALTHDIHFEQAGFNALLRSDPPA